MTTGDTVKVVRMPKGVRKTKHKFAIGDIGEVRNIYGKCAYVWFDVGRGAPISTINLEVVGGREEERSKEGTGNR